MPKSEARRGGSRQLLKHTNDRVRVGTILDNRLKSLGNSVMGTCIVNDSEPPYIHSATLKKSDSRCKHLYNLKGSQGTTMVYGKMFEDAAVRPNE